MDPQLRSERRTRWETDSSFARDSFKFRVARLVRRHFTIRTFLALLVLQFMLWSISASLFLQLPVIGTNVLVAVRLALVRLSATHKRNRFVQLVDHQSVLGRPVTDPPVETV